MKTMKTLLAAAATTAAAVTIALTPTSAVAGPGHDHNHGHDMKASVGHAAPNFTLTDLEGNEHTLADYTADGKTVVLEWFNPDCPFVKKHHEANKSMYETYRSAKENDVVWLAINSGKPGNQGTGQERNERAVKEYGIEYPVLLDESGKVGKMYQAKTTPHMYIIDGEGVLVYAGAIDNNPRFDLGDVNYVSQAIGEMAHGKAISESETRPYGCSVKY